MDLLFLSTRIYLGGSDVEFLHGGVIVSSEGTICRVLRSEQEVNTYLYNMESEAVYDFGDMILMPGLIDINVSLSEPGRNDWEGFLTGTKAAAAGGFTTIVDRPITSIPPTTSTSALKAKTSVARGKIFVDVGFWGGLVPENIGDGNDLLAAGVIGLQCSLCTVPNPVDTAFSAVDKDQLTKAINNLEDDALIAFHAELLPATAEPKGEEEEPRKYETFSKTRPVQTEVDAIKVVAEIASANKKKNFHILNVSASETLPLITNAKRNGSAITAETCPHYLTLSAEQIEDCHTEFKTIPPIRQQANQKGLWDAVHNGCLDIVSSNHSPATSGAKCLSGGKARGNFLNAWPGISSLQLGLSIMWTHCSAHDISLHHIYQTMCRNPAVLCGFQNFKGKIEEGYDADFCIWDPEEEFTVSADMLYSKNKATPYVNQRLKGVVHATVVRGLHVFQKYEGFGQPLGKIILRKTSKKVVKFVRMQ